MKMPQVMSLRSPNTTLAPTSSAKSAARRHRWHLDDQRRVSDSVLFGDRIWPHRPLG
jgi:hypothetical protein